MELFEYALIGVRVVIRWNTVFSFSSLSGLLEGSGWRENMNYIEESINKQVIKPLNT